MSLYPPIRTPLASNRLYDVPNLDDEGSNFQTWKFRITMVLDLRGLLQIVTGQEPDPGTTIPSLREEWLAKDKDARAQLTLTLSDEPLNGVLLATTAKEVWDKLNARYEGKGKQTIAFLIGELFRNTLSDESPLEPQLNAVRHKAHILASLGQSLDDSLVAVAMVISLPPSYSTIRTILMSTQVSENLDQWYDPLILFVDNPSVSFSPRLIIPGH